MKIISDYKELSGQVFDTIEACTAAEAAIDKKRADEAAASKKYDDAIKTAAVNLSEARENLAQVNREARLLVEEAHKKANDIVMPARKTVREAYNKLAQAVKDYNVNVGPYHVKVSNRSNSEIDEIIKAMFTDIYN